MLNQRHWLEITEYVCIFGSLLGSGVAAVSGQIIYAVIPISISILLNLLNRLRLEQKTKRATNATLGRMYQQILGDINSIEQSVEQRLVNRTVRRDLGGRPYPQSIELIQVQQAIAALQLQLQNRLAQFQLPDLDPIYKDIALQKELLETLQQQCNSMEQFLNNMISYVNNSSFQGRVEYLEKTTQELSATVKYIQQTLLVDAIAEANTLLAEVEVTAIHNSTVDRSYRQIDEANNLYNSDSPEFSDGLKTGIQLPAITPTIPVIVTESSYLTWKCVDSLKAHSDWVRSLAIAPDGQTIVSGSFDKTIKLWRMQDRALIHTLSQHSSGVFCLGFSPDGQTIASGSFDQTIKLWDKNTGKMLHNLIDHSGSVQCIAISPNGQTIVSGSFDETIKLWEVETGQLVDTLAEDSGPVYAIAFSPNGETLASGGGDGLINLWRLSTDEQPWWVPLGTLTGNSNLVWSLAISPDGQIIASGNGEGFINVWHLGSNQMIGTQKGHLGPIMSVVISPDGQTLISGSADGTIKLWDLHTGNHLGTLSDDASGSVISIAISPDGKTLASGCADGTIKIWQCD